MRKLATIRKISDIQPIEGADLIEVVTVDGWKVVTAKDVGHKIGDLVVYCEVDSFLPIEPEFEFLRKSSFKKMGDDEGFRLRTIKLRGQISQGLIIPLAEAIEVIKRRNTDCIYDLGHPSLYDIGTEVTELLGIQKYEPPIPAELGGKVKGNFPSFIKKTDEERIQNLVKEYMEWVEQKILFYTTEKLDGTSATYYLRDGEFGVCSRNWDMAEPDPVPEGTMVMCDDGVERPLKMNTYWKIARELDIEGKMREIGGNFAIQGEIIGEGIQANKYKLKGQTIRIFSLFDIDLFKYADLNDLTLTVNAMGLETVPLLDEDFLLPETPELMLEYAEDMSKLNPQTQREGVVIRSLDSKISFKAISNKFLIKNKE